MYIRSQQQHPTSAMPNCRKGTTSLSLTFFRGQEGKPDNLLISCSELTFSLQNSTT